MTSRIAIPRTPSSAGMCRREGSTSETDESGAGRLVHTSRLGLHGDMALLLLLDFMLELETQHGVRIERGDRAPCVRGDLQRPEIHRTHLARRKVKIIV